MPYTEAQARAAGKYQREKMEQIPLRVMKGEREKLEAARIKAGYNSMRSFIIDAINEKAGEEILTPPKPPTSPENAL